MKSIYYFTIFILYIVLFQSCRKDFFRDFSSETWALEDLIKDTANIQGYIFDLNNKPISGASIVSGDKTATSNEQGVFFIDNAVVSATNAVVKISKPGFFNCVKSFRLSEDEDNVIKVQLVEKKLSGTLSSLTGGKVENGLGTSVTLSAKGFIDESTGKVYSGNVKVFMHWLDPSKENILYQMPGELRGINSSGEERMIITYGMTTVELEGDGGQKLQLAKGAEAKIVFEIPAEMQVSAPKTIPLWYYDENKGRWLEEGAAKLVNGRYEGVVKHFSTWNCDAPYEQPMKKFCIKIKDDSNVPFANAHVLLRRDSDKWGGHGYTNGKGVLCGLLPANTPLVLEILGEPGCGQTIYKKLIGPFKDDLDMETIIIKRDPEKMITISGILVDCNGKLVKEGYVQGQVSYRASVGKVTNGKFEFCVVRCPSDDQITLYAVDNITKKLTDRITKKVDGNKINIGTITACTDASKVIFKEMAAFFPFNGNVNDESGNENHLIATGVSYATDPKRGGVAIFDGKSWLQRDSSVIKSQTGLTFSFWAKTTNNFVMDIIGQACENGCNDDIRVQLNTSQCRISGLSFKSPAFFATSPSNTADGNWHFYTLVMGQNNSYSYNNFKFYIDGEAVNIGCGHNWGGWTYTPNKNYPFMVGRAGPLGNNYSGSLDDIRVFSRALSEVEVKTLFRL